MKEFLVSSSAGQAITSAQEACEAGPVMNMILQFPVDLPGSSTGVLHAYREEAMRWQDPITPDNQYFNHGSYMYAHANPIDYLAAELKRKASSNRACLSLVDTEAITRSGDGKLPSFMLLQMGFADGSRNEVHITAYFRALEVSAFLPVNITELVLIAEAVASKIPSISRALVTIHAFRAHFIADFHKHERFRIDTIDPSEIQKLVQARNKVELVSMIKDKASPATLIETTGLNILRIELDQAAWGSDVSTELRGAIEDLTHLQTLRESGTHEPSINAMQRQVTERLRLAADLLSQNGDKNGH